MAELTLRSVARLALVNRSYPPALQRDGLLGDPLAREDVIVTRALAAIPSRWFTGGRRDGQLDPRFVAGLVRQGLVPTSTGAANQAVLTVTRWRAALADPQGETVSLLDLEDELLLLPIGAWWTALQGERSDTQEVAMAG